MAALRTDGLMPFVGHSSFGPFAMSQVDDSLSNGRRDFLRQCGIGLPLALAAGGLPALGLMAAADADAACPNPSGRSIPPRVRGTTVLDVRDYGARGNGVHDDTPAFQNAIDALPANGGTVQVPAGTYLIEATRAPGSYDGERYGVRLRSNLHLQLMSGAELLAIPNSDDPGRTRDRNYMLYGYMVNEVEISGGRIVGERVRHVATEGKKSEWGHGIQFRGVQRATIRDTEVSDCWGDCIAISVSSTADGSAPSSDIIVSNAICSGARRQGLTIATSRRITVYDSEFSNTLGTGLTGSGNGVDIEPDSPGTADVIHIENCLARNNRAVGIHVITLSGGTAAITGVTIRQCRLEQNRGYGLYVQGGGVANGFVALNQIRGNGFRGMALRNGVANYQANGNYFSNNLTTAQATSAAAEVAGWDSRLWKHIEYTDDIDIQDVIGRNFYWTLS